MVKGQIASQEQNVPWDLFCSWCGLLMAGHLDLKMEMEVMKLVKRGSGKWEWCLVVRLGN